LFGEESKIEMHETNLLCYQIEMQVWEKVEISLVLFYVRQLLFLGFWLIFDFFFLAFVRRYR